MLENQDKIQPEFCSSYTVTNTLHCTNETKYKVFDQPPEKYVHCTPEQEMSVDKNNAVYMEYCQ